jgi:hydrogenase maturation protease
MAASTASDPAPPGVPAAARPIRVLCLGNELIADDGLGILVARLLCRRLAEAGTPVPPGPSLDHALTARAFELPAVGVVEIVETALTGMYLLEAVAGAGQLIVVDTIVTGAVDPGSILELGESDLASPQGGSPHYVGLLETLDLARALGLDVPAGVVFVAVEAGDYRTVGGPMTPSVGAAVLPVVERVISLVGGAAVAA